MSKFSMKAIAGAALALVSAGAFATVTISTPTAAVVYAKELTSTGVIALTNAGTSLNLASAIGQNMSSGEVRHVRFALPAGSTFSSAAVTVSGNAGTGTLTPGAVNGIGTNVITFSITSVLGDTTSGTVLTITGNRTVPDTSTTITAEYGLYDLPSQAIAGGTGAGSGFITGVSAKPYISFAPSYELVTVPANSVAVVTATPPFSNFGPIPILDGRRSLGTVEYRLVTTPVTPLDFDGTAITLADLMKVEPNGTRLVIEGDFSAAGSVYLRTGSCFAGAQLASDTLTSTAATFYVGATATGVRQVCYQPNGTTPMPASSYTAKLNAVSADSAPPDFYTVNNLSAALGNITRDGTELQAPLVQVLPPAAGYIGRFALNNAGATDAKYTAVIRGEDGVTLSPGTLTGTIKAGTTTIFDASTIITGTSVVGGNPRGFVVFIIEGANNVIQGAYQIVNTTTGSVAITPLIRPGTN